MSKPEELDDGVGSPRAGTAGSVNHCVSADPLQDHQVLLTAALSLQPCPWTLLLIHLLPLNIFLSLFFTTPLFPSSHLPSDLFLTSHGLIHVS